MNVCEAIERLVENAYYDLTEDNECNIRPYILDVQKEKRKHQHILTIKWRKSIPAFYMGMEIGNLLWWASEPTTSLKRIKVLTHRPPNMNVVIIAFEPYFGTPQAEYPAHIAKTLDDFLYKASLIGLKKIDEFVDGSTKRIYFKAPLNEFRPGLIVGLLSFDEYTWSTSLLGDVLELTVTKYQPKE